MSREELEEGRRAALDLFGPGVGDMLHRRLRFAELTAEDVHVYQSAPPSPKRKPLALMAPSASDREDPSLVSLGEWKGGADDSALAEQPEQPSVEASQRKGEDEELEEGTPEYIRRRFFPNLPADDPSLEWITSHPTSSQPQSSPSLRFDLAGSPIPASLSTSLPTHLGLHHHADGTHAGYTLDDVFLLSRSTVPAQRAAMLGVLGRIARRLGKMRRGGEEGKGMEELKGSEEEVRTRVAAAGIEGMGQRGGVGAMGVEVLWECVVGWDEELGDVEGVEFVESKQPSPGPGDQDGERKGGDAISTLPLDYILPQISEALSTSYLPSTSLAQLLSILHRLGQHSNAYATKIVSQPQLLSSVVTTFLHTPISSQPDPLAIQLLSTLALSSRANAVEASKYADALLRFVVTLPPDSTYSESLAAALISSALEFYTVLASYGLYASIAATASEHIRLLGTYVLSTKCTSRRLMAAWLNTLSAWMVCATDPHQTTPSHEILWSQVKGWGWGEEVLDLRSKLGAEEDGYEEVWTGLWGALASWLEGARVNGVRGGEEERQRVTERVSQDFETGKEGDVVLKAVENTRRCFAKLAGAGQSEAEKMGILQEVAKDGEVLSAVLRLWLACTPPYTDGPPASPPFILPFEDISSLAAQLSRHPIWSCLHEATLVIPGYATVYLRPFSSFLCYYLRLSRRLPGTTPDLWLAQACTVVQRCLPGDEDFVQRTMEQVTALVTPGFVSQAGWNVPNAIWESGGMEILTPFFAHSARPEVDDEERYGCIGPSELSPQSIARVDTLRVPSLSTLRTRMGKDFGLPLPRDWVLSPLDHLLRSGTSPVFKALPATWEASETDVTRAVLLLAKVVREVLSGHGLAGDFAIGREEMVFGCMKVFMLEHGQDQEGGGVQEEVFRDGVVGSLMGDLLAPFSWSQSRASSGPNETLERVSRRYLGPSTPFYQFYTDFLGLYDAISFSHHLFARLLLPPLSMRYAVDYRKLLWDDFNHTLRTIRAPVEDVLSEDLAEYLYPVEQDKVVVAAYLRALVKPGACHGFLRFVAVHHVAAHIWEDLRATGGPRDEERTEKLVKAVVTQGDLDVVRQVVLYKQVEGVPIGQGLLLPPQCFEQSGSWKEERLRQAERWDLKDRLQGLLT
ncbi:hypothetical protein OE88DRAFT_1760352 [Heliocybe sulcata]|uniref:Uncharacterized protein n=1 Tax=Heliocybe sulcata TaxID=5364 RepID=A0A5C3MUT7_9AGAM|nr:hypothetical protein OE88DRAFT_1760352 [Heliocybe sulcata]